jgi:replicative DNA helicase
MTEKYLEELIKEIKKRKEFILNENDSKKLINNKLSPKDLRLEEVVLGSMIDSIPTICTLIDLVYEDFFVEVKNQKIMVAITEIYGYSGFPNIKTITKELKKNNDFDIVGGQDFLNYLSNINDLKIINNQ